MSLVVRLKRVVFRLIQIIPSWCQNSPNRACRMVIPGLERVIQRLVWVAPDSDELLIVQVGFQLSTSIKSSVGCRRCLRASASSSLTLSSPVSFHLRLLASFPTSISLWIQLCWHCLPRLRLRPRLAVSTAYSPLPLVLPFSPIPITPPSSP